MADDYIALTIRMPRDLHEKLRVIAFETRTPITRMVVAAVQGAVDNGRIIDGQAPE
jgi:predicted transcriptional regulator